MALSYQHEYHAGNHADILKHLTLLEILNSLCKKDKAFTLIDTHSGAGVFSLSDERLLKTGEAKEGIEKLSEWKENNKKSLPDSLENYFSFEKDYLSKGLYAGSPEIERRFLREGDIAHFTEKHPEAFSSLEKNMSQEFMAKTKGKIKIYREDAFVKLKALTPPLVKRGLILCDPSFEDESDYRAVTEALLLAHKKWNTAIIALWYPLLLRKKNETSQMLVALEDGAKLGVNPSECFKAELIVKDPALTQENADTKGSHLYGSGMFIINPPWGLESSLNEAIPALREVLI